MGPHCTPPRKTGKWGGDMTHGDALIAADALSRVQDGLEVEVVYGGQPHYHYLVSIE